MYEIEKEILVEKQGKYIGLLYLISTFKESEIQSQVMLCMNSQQAGHFNHQTHSYVYKIMHITYSILQILIAAVNSSDLFLSCNNNDNEIKDIH